MSTSWCEYINLLVDASGDSLQESIIGDEPEDAEHASLAAPNFHRQAYNILQAVPELPPEFRRDYPDHVDESGNLRSWDDGKRRVSKDKLEAGYDEMVKALAGGQDDTQQIRNGYEDVVRDDG